MAEVDGLYGRGARLIARFWRAHPGPFAVSVLGAIAFSAAAVSVPLIAGRVTDHLITPAFTTGVTGHAVLGGVLLLAGVGLVRGISIIVRRYYAAMLEARMQTTLRESVVEKYLDVPLSYYQEHPTGELLAHADADVLGTTTSIKPLPFSIGVFFLAVFALVSLALIDWTFAVVALILFPALTLLNRTYTARVHGPVTRLQQRLGNVSGVAHESFDGALVVKTLGLAEAEEERFSLAANELRHSALEVGELRARFDPILDALPSLGTLLLFVIGGWRIESGAVTPGDLVNAALLFSILGMPMRVFGFFLQEMPRAVVSVDRIDEVLATPDAPRVVHPGGHAEVPTGALGLAVRDLTFTYDREPVLNGVTFDVAPGEAVAIVGATGAGKSTLVSLLARLIEPAGGSISVGGTDVSSLEPDDLRAAISIVFQESFLFSESVIENVALDLPTDDPAVVAATDVARVTRFVPQLPDGWDTVVGERGVTLSGGQRQRVALARALARRPRVLVLDDATSAVDPVIEGQILDGLRSGPLEGRSTLLIVAHRLSTIRLADRVVYLDRGTVAGIGTHDELLAMPGYNALVSAYEEPTVDDVGPGAVR